MKRYLVVAALMTMTVASCIKDRVQSASGPISVGTRRLVHYWSFNSLGTYSDPKILPDSTNAAAPGFITYNAASYDTVLPGADLNVRNGDTSGGGALRMRNPYSYMIIHVPTTGYKQPILTLAVERSSKGQTSNTVTYTIDGINYISDGLTATSIPLDVAWSEVSIDFSSIPSVDDNPNFAIKLSAPVDSSGNDRYDNVSIDAYTK